MKSLILILAFFSASAFANDPWFFISSTDTHNYYAKKESFELTKSGGRFLMKFMGKNSDKPFFSFVEMRTADCKKEYGTVFILDLDGKKEFEAPYVSNGGTTAQIMGDMACFQIKQQKPI